MSHYYMRDHFGDYCTHYNRGSESYWHRCNAYPSEKVIFNYGCSSSCGCNFGINAGRTFWSGLGTGIGLGLGNLFGGFLGGFLSPFFGGGLFGGFFGMPMFSNYGMVPNYVNAFTPAFTSSFTSSSTPVKTGSNPGTPAGSSNTEDPTKALNPTGTPGSVEDLTARAEQITSTSTEEEINALINDINSKLEDSTLTETEIETLNNKKENLAAQKLLVDLSGEINWSDADLELLIKQKNNLPQAQIKKIELALANKLSHLKVAGEENLYKCSNDYKTLLMLELSGFNVRAERWVGNGDQDITGPISNVKKSDDKITYNIDCSLTGECIKGTWTFEQSSASSCRPIDLQNAQCDCQLNRNAKYTWDSENGCWLNNDSDNPSARKI